MIEKRRAHLTLSFDQSENSPPLQAMEKRPVCQREGLRLRIYNMIQENQSGTVVVHFRAQKNIYSGIIISF